MFKIFFSEYRLKFRQPYQDVASGLEHGEFLPLKHFSGCQCLSRLVSHLCFLLGWTSAIRRASIPRDPTSFFYTFRIPLFKINHMERVVR